MQEALLTMAPATVHCAFIAIPLLQDESKKGLIRLPSSLGDPLWFSIFMSGNIICFLCSCDQV